MAKVILVDSSVTIRKVVELVLSDEGFQVEAVNTGDDALAAIKQSPPALVLADVKAKGKNGYEIAQTLKADPATANIPVLLMAGAFEPVNKDLLQRSGAAGSITKPFEAKDLVAQVKSLVGAEAAPAAETEDDLVFDMSGGEEEAVEVMEAGSEEEAGVVELSEDEAVEAVEAVASEEEDLWDLGEAETAEAVEEVEAVEEAPEAVEAFEAEAAEAVEAVEEVEAVEAFEEPAPQPEQPRQQAAPQTAAVSAQALEAALPGREEMSQIFRELAAERLDKMMASIDLKAMLIDTLAPTIKESMTKILWEATPEITEKLLKDAVQNSLSTLNEKLESVIWETVPELAESIIRKEIEKIKAEG